MPIRLLHLVIFSIFLITFSPSLCESQSKTNDSGPIHPFYKSGRYTDAVQVENRTHDVGNILMTVTNWGYLGNKNTALSGYMIDPCTNDWSPQMEFPAGSGVQYMWQTGLWIGALIREDAFEYPRVSEGVSLIDFNPEMYPGPEPGNGIIERSNRSNYYNCLGDFVSDPEAISEQDFYATYTDTHRLRPGGAGIANDYDGPHVPLGLKIKQTSYAWSYNYARDFIIVDYEIENIASNFLKNLYVGLYVDGDVGHAGEISRFNDDICGFINTFKYLPEGQQDSLELTINSAWIADNDGRPDGVSSGSNFSCPDVAGARVVRAPNPKLRTSFNWWITDWGNDDLDFGPAWQDDGAAGAWTNTKGTPITDNNRYFLLGNNEFDYNQVYVDNPGYIADNPQQFIDRFTGELLEEHPWKEVSVANPTAVASGYDTRYLISWGPLGIFDYMDQEGNRIYRLNPGEKFSMTVAFVAGEGFHDRNDPQPSNSNIDERKFNYFDFQINADWAAKVYDNPMIDTDGDTWFGEDTGIDGLYSDNIGDTVSYVSWDGTIVNAIYPGKDEGEYDGLLQEEEDHAPRPAKYDYTAYNQLLDFGDGIPDFQGPPPPPVPDLSYRIEGNDVVLTWNKFPSEDSLYADPFSHEQDFEGYRIYVSNSGMENEYSFIGEFDKINFSYFDETDSLMTIPFDYESSIGRPPTIQLKDARGVFHLGFLQPVGSNIGMGEITLNETTYEYRIKDTSPLIPRYYAVTAYDFGDPKSGVQPLESAKSANAKYIAPSGSARKKPGVVPNPYRADQNYTRNYLQLNYGEEDSTSVSWENRDDGTFDFFPQTDRRVYFYNLPERCLIRIFTVSGDLVTIINHDSGQRTSLLSKWNAPYAEAWDLNSRNKQQVVSGLYIYSVEDLTEENKGHVDLGKFVIIR